MTGTPPAKTKTPERARPMWPAWLFLATLGVSHPVIVLVRYLPFDEGNVLALGHVLLWTLASALMVIILPTYHTSPRRRVLLLIPVAMIVGVFAGIPVHRVGTGWYARQLAPAVEALHRHQAETGSPAPSLDVLPRGTIPPHLRWRIRFRYRITEDGASWGLRLSASQGIMDLSQLTYNARPEDRPSPTARGIRPYGDWRLVLD